MRISLKWLFLKALVGSLTFAMCCCSITGEPQGEKGKDNPQTKKTPSAPSESAPVSEERGLWLNRSELFAPREDLLNFLDELKEAHFTTLYINTYFRGSVIYPDSRYLPRFSGVSEPDVLEWLLPEIKKRGMLSLAWLEYGFYAFHTPDATKTEDKGVFLNKHPELAAVASDGTPYLHNDKWGDFYSLCPANPESHKLLGDLFVEILERYPFDGINLDRIRFPNENFCFCPYCKKHFREDTGIELQVFEKETKEYSEFIRWRKKQLDLFMETYVPKFRKARPGVVITLASLPPEMMESHGQGWDNWMEKGLIDAAMPMLYGEANFENRIQKIKQFPHWERIFCGLDAHGLPPEKVLEQIRYLRENGAKGCAIWYSGQIGDDLPGLKAGPFSNPANSPLVK